MNRSPRRHHRIGLGGDRGRLLDQGRGEIVAGEPWHAGLGVVGLEIIFAYAAIDDVALAVDRQDLRLVELLEDVAKAQDDDLVADDQDAAVGMMKADRVERAPEAQDDVGPALAAGRSEIEFAEARAMIGEVGMALADAARGQPVEDAELALAQALVDDRLADDPQFLGPPLSHTPDNAPGGQRFRAGLRPRASRAGRPRR